MKIDIHNYEEWMMDYLDGNLDHQQSKEIEAFLLKHPHIASESDAISDYKLHHIDQRLLDPSFKSALIRKEILSTENISEENYETSFAAYHENDLNEAEQKELEVFLRKNRHLRKDIDVFEHLKIRADKSIIYGDKEKLLKKEKKIVPIGIWSGIVAAILIIGFWVMDTEPKTRPVYTPYKLVSKPIVSLDSRANNNLIPQRQIKTVVNIPLDQLTSTEEERFVPNPIASLSGTSIKIDDNDWKIQMELMQGYAFQRNQLMTRVDWSAIPSENSKSGFRLITSMLWRTTKTGVQSFSEDVFKNDLQALTSNNLETLTGGAISVKRPAKEVE